MTKQFKQWPLCAKHKITYRASVGCDQCNKINSSAVKKNIDKAFENVDHVLEMYDQLQKLMDGIE